MEYTALIVDIVNSKKMSAENREQVQFFIKKCLEVLNNVFKSSLLFNVIFSAGDEVQGLFKIPTTALMYYRLLKMILAPLQIRCGIGVGGWDIKIMNGTSSEQDGSAYHFARAAVSQADRMSGYYILFNANSKNDIYINTLLNMSFLLAQKQSKYQNQVYLLTEIMAPFFIEGSMEIGKVQDIYSLIQYKEDIAYFSPTRGKKDHLFQSSGNPVIDCDPIHIFSEYIAENQLYLESTIKKGLSTKISCITNTTRQNIDNVMKNANILAIRNIDLATLIFINRNYRR